MNPASLLATFAGLFVLVSLAAAECDDCMVKCFACDPAQHGNCQVIRTKLRTSNGCVDHKFEYYGSNSLQEVISAAPGLRYLGYAFASQCGGLFGCSICSELEGTIRCQNKYGQTLPSGEVVLGGCDTIDEYDYRGKAYCADSPEKREQMVRTAFELGEIPFIDQLTAKSFEGEEGYKYGSESRHRAYGKRRFPARVPVQREDARDYYEDDE